MTSLLIYTFDSLIYMAKIGMDLIKIRIELLFNNKISISLVYI